MLRILAVVQAALERRIGMYGWESLEPDVPLWTEATLRLGQHAGRIGVFRDIYLQIATVIASPREDLEFRFIHLGFSASSGLRLLPGGTYL